MQNQNPRLDPQDGKNATNSPGVSVPAKGDSAGSNPSGEPDATLVDFSNSYADPDATMVDGNASYVRTGPPVRPTGAGPVRPQTSTPVLQTGDVLGGRYEILQLLGEGGMGAVYKAMDRELNRPVALKLIRPELAANPSILARFKQELLLSHQVTHKNVIRILRFGRRRRREVHHHGVRRGRGPACPDPGEEEVFPGRSGARSCSRSAAPWRRRTTWA